MLSAAFLGVAALPLLSAAVVAVWLADGRPIFFSQVRCGRRGRPFRLYKLRTLPRDAASAGDREWNVRPTHPLLSRLRRTGLDELPQLWNVARGEMSLVGPRPERPFFVERFRREIPAYSRRMEVLPGITGWAQIHGLRGDTSVVERVRYDLEYIERRSAWFDAWILVRTLVRPAPAEPAPCPSTQR